MKDVVAVDLKTNKVRLLAVGKTQPNADAIVTMAAVRRGVDTEFFADCPTGKYRDGDTWRGDQQ